MSFCPKYIPNICLCFLLLFLFSDLQAQDYIAHVKKIGIEDGLSSYNVNAVFQDSEGLIWIATDYGLNRYDGSEIKSYTKEESGLCHNFVENVFQDRNGMLWIFAGDRAGDRHYCVFDKNKEKFISPESYLGKALPFDTRKTMVFKHRETFIFSEHIEGGNNLNIYELEGKEIRKLFSLKEDNIYIKDKIQEGIFKISENLYSSYWRDADPLKSLVINFDKKGNVVSTYKCDEEHPHVLGTRSIFGEHCIICSAHKGDNWLFNVQRTDGIAQKKDIAVKANWGERICLAKDRTYILNADSLKIYNTEGHLEAKLYLGLSLKKFYFGLPFVDRDGNIWVTDQENLFCIRPEKKQFTVELEDDETANRLRGIALNSLGRLNSSTIGFIYEKNGNLWEKLSLPGYNFLGFLRQDSFLWLGTENYLLCRLNSYTKQLDKFPFTKDEKSISPLLWMPFVSKEGQIWAGGNKGLYRLDLSQNELMSFKGNVFDGITVYAFYENKAGTWLSTSSGLFLVDLTEEKVLNHYSKSKKDKNFIPAEHIAHLHEDKNGIFWLATKGDGLIRWNPKSGASRQYTQKKDGLSHNVIYAVYGDDYGNLWMSSQRGLMRFHKETGAVNIYLKADGLPNNEFNTISHYQAADGQLYFGGQNGLVYFHPKNFEASKKSYPFILTECLVQKGGDDSLLSLKEDLLKKQLIKIEPGDKALIIKFALLDYQNSDNHIYSYQIEGYDKSWTYQKDHEIKISGLPYGTYKLKLRAKNANSSVWTDYPETISIQVLKPFYLQLWFMLSMIAILVLSVYSAVRWRIQNLEAGKAELEKIVKERTQKIEHDKSLIEAQAAELRSLDELKTKFFSNISHELRTPLTLILGPLSYILDNPEAWEKASVKEQLLVMQRNGKSLMGLIEEILDLSKLEANKLELLEEPTPIVQFLEYIFAVFEPQFQVQKLDYELLCQFNDKNLTVLMDRKKMEKVINNYLSNAIKFTPKNGKITLSAKAEGDLLKICVSDTGKGVHPNDLPYIFERFYQSKQTDQKLYGGTGIGLALVSDFAKLMGGKAYAESALGQGSRFYFEIPVKAVDRADLSIYALDQEISDEDLIENIGFDFTIMVVEDNMDMRDFVCNLLKTRYKNVLTANNGAEGLELLKSNDREIDLIISDVMMPEVDGLSMLREIKSNPDWMGIPVIMLTALAAERDKLTALTIGVDDYLTKPFSVSELLIRTQNLLYNYHQRKKLKALQTEEAELEIKAEPEKLPEALMPTGQKTGLSSDHLWVKEIEAKVKASIKTGIPDVEELAAALFISSRQLSRKLNELTGLSPAKFIREVQLQAALKELEDGTVISVTEVCFNNGFEQVSTFSKLFKKRFGKNPSEYLKN